MIGHLKSFLLLISCWIQIQAQTEPSALDFLYADRTLPHRQAVEALQKKDYRKAAKHFLELLRLKPDHALGLYQLSTCYAQLNQPLLAAKALERSLEVGFRELGYLLQDPLLHPIRLDPNMAKLLRRVKEMQEERGETLLVEARMALPVRLRLPRNHDPARAYPLVLLLHGHGGNPESMMGAPLDQAIVAAPRGAYLKEAAPSERSAGYSWFYPTQDKSLWERLDPLAVEQLRNTIQTIQGRYKLSGSYLLGHSQGGALAYLAGLNHPKSFRGILVFGARDPRQLVEADTLLKARELPIFLGHGRQDAIAPFSTAEKARDFLKEQGFQVAFEAWDGGHELPDAAVRKAWTWIQEREKGLTGK